MKIRSMHIPLPHLTLTSRDLRGSSAASTFIHSMAFLLLLIIGACGLVCESPNSSNPERASELRVVFALLLMTSATGRVYWGVRLLKGRSNKVCTGFARRTSRCIYLLLYCLVATQLWIDLVYAAAEQPLQLNTGHCLAYIEYGFLAQVLSRTLVSKVGLPR